MGQTVGLARMVPHVRAVVSRRGWKIQALPPALLVLVVTVDLAAVAASVWAVLGSGFSRHSLGVLLLLVITGVAFEELATRVARLQWRLSEDLKRDMTSVWVVAAAVALPPIASVALLLVLFAQIWWRQQRRTGQPMHRTFYTGSTSIISCLVAGVAVRAFLDSAPAWPWAVSGAVSVVIAIAIHTTVNRALITLALLGSGARGRQLIGSRDDNLTELSILCLGGLVALAALHQPWLCLLAVAPLVALQRGAFVKELEALATTDSKTGLLNAVAWEQIAARELARAQRQGQSMGVLIADIDRFKQVNDRFGHLVGDEVLRGIAKCLRSAVRDYDGVGRFGGEEFVAVLPETSAQAAMDVAERIRARVATLTVKSLAPLADDLEGAPLSVSVGVAMFERGDGDTELAELLHAADRALYRAKADGRNQVRLATNDEGLPEPVAG